MSERENLLIIFMLNNCREISKMKINSFRLEMDFGVVHAHAHLYKVFWFLSVPSSNFSLFT